MNVRIGVAATLLMTGLVAACGDGVTGPTLERRDVAGVYEVTTFRFDPLGLSLGPIELLALFDRDLFLPRLLVSAGDSVEFAFAVPFRGLVTTASGNYVPTATGISIIFRRDRPQDATLVPQQLTLEFTPTVPPTLSFSGPVLIDTDDRDLLIRLVPELADFELADPLPGDLTIVFTRVSDIVVAAGDGTSAHATRAVPAPPK